MEVYYCKINIIICGKLKIHIMHARAITKKRGIDFCTNTKQMSCYHWKRSKKLAFTQDHLHVHSRVLLSEKEEQKCCGEKKTYSKAQAPRACPGAWVKLMSASLLSPQTSH